MTTTAEANAQTIKAAISQALHDTEGAEDTDRVDTIHAAVKQALTTILPGAIAEALKQPALITGLVTPVLAELEDVINDHHDDRKTPDAYRPGLRWAARLIRDVRRETTQDQK